MADDSDAIWLPVLGDFSRTGRQLADGAGRAGRAAGQRLGQEMAAGAASQAGAVEKATARAAAAQDKVSDAVGRRNVAEAKLADLQARGVTRGGQYAAALEAVARAGRNVGAAERQASQASDDLAAANARAASSTDQLAQSSSRGGSGLKSLFSGAGSGIKQMAALAAGAAGASSAVAAVSKSMSNQADYSKLAAAQGASPELAKEYGKTAGKLYASGVGDSMGEVTSAIDAAQSSFATLGSEGEASLEQVTTRAVNFGKTFGTDVDEAVQTASQLVSNGLAKDSTQAFDLMTTSFQRVPKAMRGELPEILNEYGTNFRALGIEGPDAFNMLVSAAGKGKFALDKTGDALKEFTIRGSDMSKASTDAYKAIGLDAEKMSRDVASGGPAAQAALQQTAQGLLKITDPAERANTAIALFGTPLEDLSVDQIPAFLSSLTGAEDGMAGFEGSTDQMGKTLNDNALSKIETFKRGIESGIVNMLGAKALPVLGDFSESLTENKGSLLGAVAGMTGLTGAVTGLEQAKGVFDSVKDGVTSVKDGFVSAKDGIKSAWDTASKAGNWAGQKARAVGSFVATSASATANAAKTSAVWVGAQAKAGAGWLVTQGKAIGSFVATAASATGQAAATSATWIGAQVAAGAGWLAMQARAVGSFIAMGASAVAQAAVSSGAWVASTATTVGSLAVQGAAFIAQRAIMVGGAVATGVMTAAQWALNTALSANPIGLVVVAIGALVAGVVLAYKNSETFRNIVQGAFSAVADAGQFMYEKVLKPAFDGIVTAFRSVGDFLGATGRGIGDVFSTVGRAIGGAFSGALDVARPALHGIGNLLAAIPEKIFGKSIPGMGAVRNFANTLQSFRDGGPVAGPGTATSDSIPAMLSNGEFVEPAAAVTPQTLPVLEAIRGGWVPPAGLLHEMVPGFADGGLVTKDALRDFARGVDGKPYVWGGVEWGDCSGAVSAIANFATGRPPFGSRFATGSEADELAARGFKPGLGPEGSLNIGWFNGGPYGGHTAATLPTGENFEMGGAYGGGKFGGTVGAADAQFSEHAHLPPEFFAGGDKIPGVDLDTEMGSAGTPPAAATSGGATSGGTANVTPGSSSGATSAPSAGTSSGASSMSLSDLAGDTASSFAKESLKDTLGFFGLEKFADLPIIPPKPEPALTAPRADRQAGEGTDPVGGGAGDGRQAPLVQVDTIVANDPDEAATKLGREVRRGVRSDMLVGGRG